MAEEKEMVAEEPKSSNMPMILVAVLTPLCDFFQPDLSHFEDPP